MNIYTKSFRTSALPLLVIVLLFGCAGRDKTASKNDLRGQLATVLASDPSIGFKYPDGKVVSLNKDDGRSVSASLNAGISKAKRSNPFAGYRVGSDFSINLRSKEGADLGVAVYGLSYIKLGDDFYPIYLQPTVLNNNNHPNAAGPMVPR